MKRILLLLVISFSSVFIIEIKADYLEKYCLLYFEGQETMNKKYFLHLNVPRGYYHEQYLLWRILKDRGYEQTSFDKADIILRLDIEQAEALDFGSTVTETYLTISAYSKKYTNSTIPYWKIYDKPTYIGRSTLIETLLFIDKFWFRNDFVGVIYRDYHEDGIKRIKSPVLKYKSTKDDITTFYKRREFLLNNSYIEEYNRLNSYY